MIGQQRLIRKIKTNIIPLLLVFLFCLLTPACNPPIPDSLPGPDAPLRSGTNPQPNEKKAAQPISKLSIYLDVSGSMEGYVVRRKGTPKHEVRYKDTLSRLDAIANQMDFEKQYFQVGTEIIKIENNDDFIEKATELHQINIDEQRVHTFYDNDYNDDSKIDEALNKAAEQKDENAVSIFITDLVLSEDSVSFGTGATAQPLCKSLGKGLGVGIIAVKSRFCGKVYDLPIPTGKYYLNGWRPFFILLVGKPRHVEFLYEKLKDPYIEQTEDWHFVLFSPAPPDRPISMDRIIEQGGVECLQGVISPAWLCDCSFPEKAQFFLEDGHEGVALHADLSDACKPWRPVISCMEPIAQSCWVYDPAAGQQNGWTELPSVSLASCSCNDLNLEIFLFQKGLQAFPPKKTCFYRMELGIGALSLQSPGFQWISEWSKTGEEIKTLIVSKTAFDFFPAMNFQLLCKSLCDFLSREMQGEPAGDISLVFCRK